MPDKSWPPPPPPPPRDRPGLGDALASRLAGRLMLMPDALRGSFTWRAYGRNPRIVHSVKCCERAGRAHMVLDKRGDVSRHLRRARGLRGSGA